jgi:hypothetical protein
MAAYRKSYAGGLLAAYRLLFVRKSSAKRAGQIVD